MTTASVIDKQVEFDEYSEFCWLQISLADFRYLTGPRDNPEPCAWCGGRLVHNPLCDELRQSWEPALTFGKHAGKRLSEVPRDYLEWLLSNAGAITSELREAIEFHLCDEG